MGQMGAMSPMDPYGLNGLVTNQAPPRPLGLTMPKTPSKATSAYLWKSQPESAARVRCSGVQFAVPHGEPAGLMTCPIGGETLNPFSLSFRGRRLLHLRYQS